MGPLASMVSPISRLSRSSPAGRSIPARRPSGCTPACTACRQSSRGSARACPSGACKQMGLPPLRLRDAQEEGEKGGGYKKTARPNVDKMTM
eukprot:1189749-Prorocentrum_minimum.AAC.1